MLKYRVLDCEGFWRRKGDVRGEIPQGIRLSAEMF